MKPRYGISEWFGRPFSGLSSAEIAERATSAAPVATGTSGASHPPRPCPFQDGRTCNKRGGVCSIRLYDQAPDGLLGEQVGRPVITCPKRFEEDQLLVRWLSEIAGFNPEETQVAREVPFMLGTETNKSAGKIDLVVARTSGNNLAWYGLEIQAVYFSGKGMESEFRALRRRPSQPAFPDAMRRPDWRSSGAKRLMPQLQIKVPTLRRWGAKLAVAVDLPFFESLGGPSPDPSQDLGDGDIIWLVPELSINADGSLKLVRGHWEVLTLEESSDKLLAAKTVSRKDFEDVLRDKLSPLV